MSGYRELLRAAVDATVIHSAIAYSWFGRRSLEPPFEVRAAMTPGTARAHLLRGLQACLYREFYSVGFPAMTSGMPLAPPSTATTSLAEALALANAGRGPWESGWTFQGQDAHRFVASRDGLRIWVDPSDVLAEGHPEQRGQPVRVHMPKELLRLSPGFYTAAGDREFPGDPTAQVVRFYWNLRPQAATTLVRVLTTELNDLDIAFRLKVVDDEYNYTRCDAAVLYVPKDCYARAAEVVAATHARLLGGLKPLTPAFTRGLAPGLALAEDPGGGDSFGMSRCHLLADGLVQAHDLCERSSPARMGVVEARFERAGISLETPYLNAGSTNDYAW